MSEFAQVIVDISHERVDRPFTYRIPQPLRDAVTYGTRVRVPFGSGDRERTGYVVDMGDDPGPVAVPLKEVIGLADGAARPDADGLADASPPGDPQGRMIALAAWMKEQYGSTMIQALRTVLPGRAPVAVRKRGEIALAVSRQRARELLEQYEKKNQKAKARLVRELLDMGTLPAQWVTGKLAISGSTLKSLEAEGVIVRREQTVLRNPVPFLTGMEAGGAKEGGAKAGGQEASLSQDQGRIVHQILDSYDAGDRRPSLIHGVTGSGKTEVYLRLIEGMAARGKQSILLIPEISLTWQTLKRFYRRFQDRVSVMNSSLSAGERQDQRQRAMQGELDVIIGPRSALFTPFPNLGMVLIDEEHEATYKSETMPRYHARDVAVQLAKLSGATVVMGSATPSLESYEKALRGEYHLFTMKERIGGGKMPQVQVADLRRELREGNRSIFSRQLQELLEDRLEKGEQSMLFLNRRGYAGFVCCRSCGYVCKCPHCDVSLSEHQDGRLVCHYCGYSRPAVRKCPSCGSVYIRGFRAGTQQVQEQLTQMFPKARLLRMDADTTRRKGSYERILSSFANREADILIGTQMIVKGHDFPSVTLVGILAADLSLAANDFRAGERTFQLLTQASGRAGRGSRPGQVVIQTYQPDHYSVRYAQNADYEGFFREELLYRRMLSYPPAAHILTVQISSPSREEALEAAREAAGAMRAYAGQSPDIPDTSRGPQIIGPAPAQIGKMNDVYRFQVLAKAPEYGQLVRLCRCVEESRRGSPERAKGVLQFDFDPLHAF